MVEKPTEQPSLVVRVLSVLGQQEVRRLALVEHGPFLGTMDPPRLLVILAGCFVNHHR